jgi:hypothetical protein
MLLSYTIMIQENIVIGFTTQYAVTQIFIPWIQFYSSHDFLKPRMILEIYFHTEKIVFCLQMHSGTEKNYFSPLRCKCLCKITF